jgi:hypothetical protein
VFQTKQKKCVKILVRNMVVMEEVEVEEEVVEEEAAAAAWTKEESSQRAFATLAIWTFFSYLRLSNAVYCGGLQQRLLLLSS